MLGKLMIFKVNRKNSLKLIVFFYESSMFELYNTIKYLLFF